MIKHILKIIQTQRRSNVWIFAELVIVAAALWFMVDKMYVDMRTWYSPLGYDIENTWRFKLSQLTPASPLFVVDAIGPRQEVGRHFPCEQRGSRWTDGLCSSHGC